MKCNVCGQLKRIADELSELNCTLKRIADALSDPPEPPITGIDVVPGEPVPRRHPQNQ